jgi:gamma-glutamyltranspeptidase/glutathione hydrolase
VVKDGKTRLVTGSPGGRTIPNTVLRIVTGVIDFGLGVREAVELGRVHHQWMPDRISLEYRLEQSLVEEMTSRGHTVTRRVRQGDGHSILVDPNDGSLRPGTDRRLRGSAYGF